MKQMMALITMVLFLVPLTTSAQDFCEGNFDYDHDVDGTDAFNFKTDFGRSLLKNPCPPDGPAPVAQTGQRTSYATGDDGDLKWGIKTEGPRFADNGNGTVTDKLTGLTWLQDMECGDVVGNWTSILVDCQALASGMCGLTDGSSAGDWRFPNVKELLTLIDYSKNQPALPAGHFFTNPRNASYWTSTTYSPDESQALRVSLANGKAYEAPKTNNYYTIPVKEGYLLQDRFTDNGDGTVTDNTSGLIWLKDAGCIWGGWQADAWFSTNSLHSGQCGLSDGSNEGDWRMPTREEWKHLVCPQYNDPAMCNTVGTGPWTEADPFVDVRSEIYWTNETGSGFFAWAIDLLTGNEIYIDYQSSARSWPVRGPE
jgi:hypothetical protein